VKNRILFVQHMSLRIAADGVAELFEKFGRLIKCEQLIPGKDMWMIQYTNAKVSSSVHKCQHKCCALNFNVFLLARTCTSVLFDARNGVQASCKPEQAR
jgi:hypothetical protein